MAGFYSTRSEALSLLYSAPRLYMDFGRNAPSSHIDTWDMDYIYRYIFTNPALSLGGNSR